MSSNDEFPLRLRGNWKSSSEPIKREAIELDLRGTWLQKTRFTWTANLNGNGTVYGLSVELNVSGTLKVTLPMGKCEIHIEFSDPRGTNHIIEASIPFIVTGAIGARLKGELSRGKNVIGYVEIDIDWAPFKEATASLWSALWKPSAR
jgi:hypothetical protein